MCEHSSIKQSREEGKTKGRKREEMKGEEMGSGPSTEIRDKHA